jgi:hypothetical protein
MRATAATGSARPRRTPRCSWPDADAQSGRCLTKAASGLRWATGLVDACGHGRSGRWAGVRAAPVPAGSRPR